MFLDQAPRRSGLTRLESRLNLQLEHLVAGVTLQPQKRILIRRLRRLICPLMQAGEQPGSRPIRPPPAWAFTTPSANPSALPKPPGRSATKAAAARRSSSS